MRTIKWHLSLGLAGCDQEGEFEVNDNATEEEIEEEVKEEIFNFIEWNWRIGNDVNKAISQLEDLKKDAQSHISYDKLSSVFKDNVEALQMAIDVLRGLNTDHNSTGSTMERYTRVLETGMICPIHGVARH